MAPSGKSHCINSNVKKANEADKQEIGYRVVLPCCTNVVQRHESWARVSGTLRCLRWCGGCKGKSLESPAGHYREEQWETMKVLSKGASDRFCLLESFLHLLSWDWTGGLQECEKKRQVLSLLPAVKVTGIGRWWGETWTDWKHTMPHALTSLWNFKGWAQRGNESGRYWGLSTVALRKCCSEDTKFSLIGGISSRELL